MIVFDENVKVLENPQNRIPIMPKHAGKFPTESSIVDRLGIGHTQKAVVGDPFYN